MADNRFSFEADWFDAQASLNKRYQLFFYPNDNSIELYEVKTKRQFLKRCKQENIQLSDLFLGNIVTILSRTMKIVEYGDAFTSRALSSNQQKTCAILTSGHLRKLGQIIDSVYKNGLKIAQMRQVQLSHQEVYQLLDTLRDRPNFNLLINAICEGPVVVLELMGADCFGKWINILGKSDVTTDIDQESMNKINASLLQQKRAPNTAVYSDTTCCLVKPHIIAAGMAGAVIFEIQKAGFEISAIQTVNFTKPNAEEFLEVYKGVLQEYPDMVDELISGTSIAIEIRLPQNTYHAFRDFCGPHDPEIARSLRPNTLRAQFGLDKIRNAVHCTDLPEDSILEVEYFFRILDQ